MLEFRLGKRQAAPYKTALFIMADHRTGFCLLDMAVQCQFLPRSFGPRSRLLTYPLHSHSISAIVNRVAEVQRENIESMDAIAVFT